MKDEQHGALQPEQLSSDIQAFCALIACIMMRCLREKNPQVMELLSLSSCTETEEAKTGGTDDAA